MWSGREERRRKSKVVVNLFSILISKYMRTAHTYLAKISRHHCNLTVGREVS